MFGVAKCALLFFGGYLTMALPLERNQRRLNFQVRTEVLQQGPPCETGAKSGDTITITFDTTIQTGDEVERTPQRTMQFTLGDNVLPFSDDRLVGMCPGDIRRVARSVSFLGHVASSANFDMELLSIGVVIPLEMDTNGDNTLDREEVANILAQAYGDESLDQAAFSDLFNNVMDTNDDGVLDVNEWQTLADRVRLGPNF